MGGLMTLSIAQALDQYIQEPLAGMFALSGIVTMMPPVSDSQCHPFSWPLPSQSLRQIPLFLYNKWQDKITFAIFSYVSYIVLTPIYAFTNTLTIGWESDKGHGLTKQEI